MRQIFIHLHIPKCGGSTVSDLLSRNFGASLGRTNSILNDYQYNEEQVARIIDYYPHFRCLTGHKLSLSLPFNRTDLALVPFTWIRDPVDRFISHYFFHRNHTTFVPEASSMDLKEYTEWALEEGNQPMFINGQTRFLSGGSLEKIQNLLDEGSFYLFPLSRLQESIFTLAQKYPNAFTYTHISTKNVSKKDQAIPEDIRDTITPFVEEDMKLLALAEETPLVASLPRGRDSFLRRSLSMRSHLYRQLSRELSRAARYFERHR